MKGPDIAIYPGSFDPITYGHLDLIDRGLAVFDRLIVAIAVNPDKSGLFSIKERQEMIHEAVRGNPRVEIDRFEGLLVNYARRHKARVILRGLRALSDFEYEFEMAMMNKRMYPDLETLFMMTGQSYFYVSSRRIKEIVEFGGNVEGLVPPTVLKRLEERLRPR